MFQVSKNWAADPKFRELLLYIAEKSRGDKRFGSVKLNKILYYADFRAYRHLGQSISGDEYQHLDEGPAPRHLLPVRESLLEDGSAIVRQVEVFNNIQKRLEPRREPDLSKLTEDEIAIVDSVMDELRYMNATEVSLISHAEIGWRLTRDRETIPYSTAWLSGEPLSQEQVEAGLQIAERHGLVAPG